MKRRQLKGKPLIIMEDMASDLARIKEQGFSRKCLVHQWQTEIQTER